MALFDLKLWEKVFQIISDISFFDASIKVFVRTSTNCLFLRSHGFLNIIGRCALKHDPKSFDFQLSTTFGRGVKVVHTPILVMTFGQK